MAVTTTHATVDYNGNGATTNFTVTFQFFAGSDLRVIETDADGDVTIKALTTHYTVAGGQAADGTPATGMVTMLVAPASGVTLTIRRATPQTQPTTFTNNDAFPSKTVEAAYDRRTLIEQELDLAIERGISGDAGDAEEWAFAAEAAAGASAASAVVSANESDEATDSKLAAAASAAAAAASALHADSVASTLPLTLTGFYANTTAGLAATSSGGYFFVPGTGLVFATLYLDNSGVAVSQNTVPSSSYMAMLAGGMARPQEQAGPGVHLQIGQCTATGKPVDLGGYDYVPAGALGTFGVDQFYQGRGCDITWSLDSLMVVLSQGTDVRGVNVIGTGNPADTANSAFRIPNNKGMVTLDIKATDMGKDAFQNLNNANRDPSRITGSFFENECAINHLERGEYCLTYGFSIGAVAVTPGTSTKVGIKMRGGNNPVVGGMITNMGVGIDVIAGANDSHTCVTGVTSNHNDILLRVGNISTHDFGYVGGALYAGKVELGGTGIRLLGNSCGSWGVVEKSTADNTAFFGNTFRHMPDDPTNLAAYGGYVPNDGGASCVHYYGNILPTSVLGNDAWRQTTAVSKRTVGSGATIANNTPTVVDFGTSLVNALQANSAFSKYELWNTTNKCWTMLTFASPISSGLAEPAIQLTLGKATAFNDTAVDVYLSLRNNSGVEQERHYFSRSGERTDGADKKRVFTFNGKVEKHYRMCVVIDNRSGGSIELYAHNGPEFPSLGRVCGW